MSVVERIQYMSLQRDWRANEDGLRPRVGTGACAARVARRRLSCRGVGAGSVGADTLHVQAKRYLVALEPKRADRLSPASRETLALQGGAMTPFMC